MRAFMGSYIHLSIITQDEGEKHSNINIILELQGYYMGHRVALRKF